jgi:Type IV secretion-system coupling protein DNA-binding domain
MSLLDRFKPNPKWKETPNDVTTYPKDFQEVIIRIQKEIRAIYEQELAQLRHFGMLEPTLQTDFILEPKDETFDNTGKELYQVVISFPKYKVPKNKIARPPDPTIRAWGYIYSSDDQPAGAANATQKGQPGLAEPYYIRWFNRDPYDAFLPTSEAGRAFIRIDKGYHQRTKKYIYGNFDFSPANNEHWKFPPLEEVTVSLPPLDDVQRREERVIWFATLGEDAAHLFIKPEARITNLARDNVNNPIYNVVSTLNLPIPELRASYKTIKVLPSGETRAAISEHLFENLRGVKHPFAFEVIAESDLIYFQLSFHPADQQLIEQQMQIHLPDYAIIAHTPTQQPSLYTVHAAPSAPVEQLKPIREFTLDPYSQLFAALAQLSPTERACVRFYCAPLSNDDIETILEPITNHLAITEGRFADAKKDKKFYEFVHQEYKITGPQKQANRIEELIKKVEAKRPAWFLGVMLQATNKTTLERLQRQFLRQYETHQQSWKCTELAATASADLPAWSRSFIPWNLINADELLSVVHFPTQNLNCDRLERASMKSSLPPPLYSESGIVLGESSARGITKEVTLPNQVRDRHVYMIGRTRSGKSTLLFNMILQDILRGSGVGVIDPHGDLVQKLLEYIPERRIQDTVYLNPTDEEHPIPLNILNASTQDSIGVLADDLVVTFRRLSDSWGERMDSVLRSVVYTLLKTPGATFFDIQKILRDPKYRQTITANLDYPPLQEFWEYDFPQMPKDASQPILHRMSKFALFPTLYNMLSQPTSSLNFDSIMQEKKILLVNLSQGELGEDNSKLIGCLLVSQIQLAAMRRAKMSQGQRQPFYLYIDEFQNFTSSAFEKILSEAGKYMLMLTVCHQYISQLDEKTKDAILGNVGTMLVLPVNEKDAVHLRHSLGDYELPDILNLDAARHEALCRPATKASDTFRFVTLSPPPSPNTTLRARSLSTAASSTAGSQHQRWKHDPQLPHCSQNRSCRQAPGQRSTPRQACQLPHCQ